MRPPSLTPGSVVVLSLDKSLVFVEDVAATYAAVVALPDQTVTSKVFVPGRVGAKKISPYSTADSILTRESLTERNQRFLNEYETLRGKHGVNHVFEKKQEDPVSVVKAGPVNKRAVKRAEAAQAAGEETPKRGRVAVPTDTRYVLVSDDLTQALAQERGDKYKDGNRSWRVVQALKSLNARTGTVDEITEAVVRDGGKPMSNPVKVVRRTMHQLMSEAFGQVVRRA